MCNLSNATFSETLPRSRAGRMFVANSVGVLAVKSQFIPGIRVSSRARAFQAKSRLTNSSKEKGGGVCRDHPHRPQYRPQRHHGRDLRRPRCSRHDPENILTLLGTTVTFFGSSGMFW